MMRLAKPALDLGLNTNRRDDQLAFWQQRIGLPYDHMGKLGGGMQQHRHHLHGSILKVNHARDPLPPAAPSGFRRLWIARPGIEEPVELADPDGNAVRLIPPGQDAITDIAIELAANDVEASRRFYVEAMGFTGLACGTTRLILTPGRVEPSPDWRAPGFRYITVQVFDAVAAHARVLARGGTEAVPPRVLGDVVRFSFVRDPDGNFIEISERTTLTGRPL